MKKEQGKTLVEVFNEEEIHLLTKIRQHLAMYAKTVQPSKTRTETEDLVARLDEVILKYY